MPNSVLPEAEPAMPPAQLRHAGAWLARHGLGDARPTPMLAARLAVRRRARIVDALLLAGLLLAAALTQATLVFDDPAPAGVEPDRRTPLLVMTALVAGLLVGQWLLDWWVRRVDHRASATLSRRAAHPLPPGWRAVLGWPLAACAVASFVAATLLVASALTVRDGTVRYAAVILLIGLLGVGAGRVVELRHLLTRPVVADDEASLTADVIMRVEDARSLADPTVLWCMPVVLLIGAAPDWWDAASIALTLLAAVTFSLIVLRSPRCAAVARQVTSAR